MKTTIQRSLGRAGGKARSAGKTLAARQNIRLRWHERAVDGVIPEAALIDGAWYLGEGRTAAVALWDAHACAFHTVAINTVADPADYPRIARRDARLKQETHRDRAGGTFAPRRILAAE